MLLVILTKILSLIAQSLMTVDIGNDETYNSAEFIFSSSGEVIDDFVADDDDSQDFTNIDISLELLNGILALVAQPYIQEATESMYFNSI
jgi:hypothetical protein